MTVPSVPSSAADDAPIINHRAENMPELGLNDRMQSHGSPFTAALCCGERLFEEQSAHVE